MQSTFEVGFFTSTPKCNINDFKINLKALFHNCGLAVDAALASEGHRKPHDFDAQLKTHKNR